MDPSSRKYLWLLGGMDTTTRHPRISNPRRSWLWKIKLRIIDDFRNPMGKLPGRQAFSPCDSQQKNHSENSVHPSSFEMLHLNIFIWKRRFLFEESIIFRWTISIKNWWTNQPEHTHCPPPWLRSILLEEITKKSNISPLNENKWKSWWRKSERWSG